MSTGTVAIFGPVWITLVFGRSSAIFVSKQNQAEGVIVADPRPFNCHALVWLDFLMWSGGQPASRQTAFILMDLSMFHRQHSGSSEKVQGYKL